MNVRGSHSIQKFSQKKLQRIFLTYRGGMSILLSDDTLYIVVKIFWVTQIGSNPKTILIMGFDT